MRNVLRLDRRMQRQPYRLHLELDPVAINFLRTPGAATGSSSSVRSRCPTYRMKFLVSVDSARQLAVDGSVRCFTAYGTTVNFLKPVPL